jgi:hypothetical protein
LLTGEIDLLEHYGLKALCNEFCEKTIPSTFSSFVDKLPGINRDLLKPIPKELSLVSCTFGVPKIEAIDPALLQEEPTALLLEPLKESTLQAFALKEGKVVGGEISLIFFFYSRIYNSIGLYSRFHMCFGCEKHLSFFPFNPQTFDGFLYRYVKRKNENDIIKSMKKEVVNPKRKRRRK